MYKKRKTYSMLTFLTPAVAKVKTVQANSRKAMYRGALTWREQSQQWRCAFKARGLETRFHGTGTHTRVRIKLEGICPNTYAALQIALA